MWPEKKRTNAWQCPQNDDVHFSKEKHAMVEYKESPNLQHSNSSSLTTDDKWLSEYDPLKEPGPLGLKLEKSPAFLELIQQSLNEAYYKNHNAYFPTENLQVRKKKDAKAKLWSSSDPMDKLKASNFPALRLKIGDWEYVSQRDNDLVGKCYFAKHKLVYEILDDGLRNKIEIQWEDILGLKANIPENGTATLAVRLRKEPLFFRESNPQPRKHTIWQPTCDFTGGKVSRFREHYLECAQGVLNKHYEKLIHCDTRLNFLSQQFDPLLDMLINAPNVSHNFVCNKPEMSIVPYVDINNAMLLQPISQCPPQDANFAQKDISKNNNVNVWYDVNDYSNPKGMIYHSSTSQCLLKDANCAQKGTSEDRVNNGLEGGNDYSNPNGMVYHSSTSQCLLKDDNCAQNDTSEDRVNNGSQGGNYYSNLACNIAPDDYWRKQGWELEVFGNVSECKQDLGMSRKDSFTDLLSQLPTITTLYDDDNTLYP